MFQTPNPLPLRIEQKIAKFGLVNPTADLGWKAKL